MTIDIKSMGYIRVASTDLEAWKTFAGKVLGLAEGRGPNPENQYWRIDPVSARIVVFPADVDQHPVRSVDRDFHRMKDVQRVATGVPVHPERAHLKRELLRPQGLAHPQ